MFRIPSIAATAIGVIALSGSAIAHPRLTSATPGATATVAKPRRIVLGFSERLISPMSGGDVFMTGTATHAAMKPARVAGVAAGVDAGGKSLVLTMNRPLVPGDYRVHWHAVSIDTHRVEGSLSFHVK